MNLSPAWEAALTIAGFETTHWSNVGRADAPDIEIMEYARTYDYVVLTHDLDFGSILVSSGEKKPSVIQIRSEDLRPETLGPLVIAALRQVKDALDSGALATLDARRVRVRLLPMKD